MRGSLGDSNGRVRGISGAAAINPQPLTPRTRLLEPSNYMRGYLGTATLPSIKIPGAVPTVNLQTI